MSIDPRTPEQVIRYALKIGYGGGHHARACLDILVGERDEARAERDRAEERSRTLEDTATIAVRHADEARAEVAEATHMRDHWYDVSAKRFIAGLRKAAEIAMQEQDVEAITAHADSLEGAPDGR